MCLSNDPDKDVDSVTGPELDVASCRRAFQYLAKVSPVQGLNLFIKLKKRKS